MKYRKFGKLEWEVSALGFGAMRLPVIGESSAKIDEKEAIGMIRYAVDHGVNYLDTGYPYHEGYSEVLVGRALKEGYRDKIKVATKLPARMVTATQDFDRFLNEQLERLQIDKIDFYLLHGLNAITWPRVHNLGVLDWAESRMAQGKFTRLGFSFHDNYNTFKEIVDSYDNWVLAQIQYNYMDVDFQAGQKGLEYAANKGLALVIMEPLRGGRLAKELPEKIKKLWETASHKRTPADWGLSWAWNQPEVSVVLSGMSTMEQVKENVEIAGRSGINTFAANDIATIDKVRAAYNGLSPVPCTGCGYCIPCPNSVAIPKVFSAYNDTIIYDDIQNGQVRYYNIEEEEQANQCLECGQCLEACPQRIDIPKFLKKAHVLLKR